MEAEEKWKGTELAQIFILVSWERNWGSEVKDVPKVSQLVSGTPGPM